MGRWRWLQPGLHLKRWVLVICVGTIFLILGAIMLGVGLFTPSTPDMSMPFNPYAVGVVLIGLGAICIFTGVYRLVRRIEKLLRRQDEGRGLTELALQNTHLEQGPAITCLGGGTGLSTMLSGLKSHSSRITAIVSVADDGGSSGRLRSDFDMLPPGDIRNCLCALADAGPVMEDLMQYRFDSGEFSGHSFGNLFIMVLAIVRGEFGLAVREANRILNVRGQVLPACLDRVSLVATHEDGTKTTGQRHIAKCDKAIAELSLKPVPGELQPDVLDALVSSEMTVIGPGSLYTSVLPNLLDQEVVQAINRSKSLVVFVVNTMGQPGETRNFTVSDHIRTLLKHAPGLRLDCVIVNAYRPSPAKLQALAEKGIQITEYDRKDVSEFGVKVLLRDVINLDNPVLHDPAKLGVALMEAFRLREPSDG